MSAVEDEAIVALDTTRERGQQRSRNLNRVTAHFTYQVTHRDLLPAKSSKVQQVAK